MRDSSPLVANERIKAGSGLLFNLGGALAAAAIVRFYTTLIVDSELFLWAFGAGTIIYIAWLLLGLLEAEA